MHRGGSFNSRIIALVFGRGGGGGRTGARREAHLRSAPRGLRFGKGSAFFLAENTLAQKPYLPLEAWRFADWELPPETTWEVSFVQGRLFSGRRREVFRSKQPLLLRGRRVQR